MKNQHVKNGLYRHYKGKMYRLIDVVRHSETLEHLVLHETLYENDNGRLWVRPYDMFFETVNVTGAEEPRFKFMPADHQ